MSWSSLFGHDRGWPVRRRAAVLGAVVVAAVGVIAAGGFHHTLTYYRTPSEVIKQPPAAGQDLRVGGLVIPGSVVHRGLSYRFVITDGARDLHVVSQTAPPRTFRAGQGAIVQGFLSPDGVFHANQVLVRHSNVYKPPKSPQ